MSTTSDKPFDMAAAVERLRGLPKRRLDGNWLARDRRGRIAFFIGGDRGRIHHDAETSSVSDALDAQRRAADLHRATSTAGEGYRGAGDRGVEAIWDAPRDAEGQKLHEARFEGYPHLVISLDPVALRVAMEPWSAVEALARQGLGAVFPVIGAMTYDELHTHGVCEGCRVVDDPADPRPAAPELLAKNGLYVYGHTSERSEAAYYRIASPSVAADLGDLEPLVQALASLVQLDVDYENDAAITPGTEWLR